MPVIQHTAYYINQLLRRSFEQEAVIFEKVTYTVQLFIFPEYFLFAHV